MQEHCNCPSKPLHVLRSFSGAGVAHSKIEDWLLHVCSHFRDLLLEPSTSPRAPVSAFFCFFRRAVCHGKTTWRLPCRSFLVLTWILRSLITDYGILPKKVLHRGISTNSQDLQPSPKALTGLPGPPKTCKVQAFQAYLYLYLQPSWTRRNMTFERTLLYSLYTPNILSTAGWLHIYIYIR